MPATWSEETTYKFVQELECLWNIHSILYRKYEAQENATKVITEDMALEQFGDDEVKQTVKRLLATCGGGQNKIHDLRDHDPFCAASRQVGC
jgi:hypothetical protein